MGLTKLEREWGRVAAKSDPLKERVLKRILDAGPSGVTDKELTDLEWEKVFKLMQEGKVQHSGHAWVKGPKLW